jgi:hypothetical protein
MPEAAKQKPLKDRLRVRNAGTWIIAGLMIVPGLAVAYTYHLLTSSVTRTTLVSGAIHTIGPNGPTIIRAPQLLEKDRDNAALVLQFDPGEVTISNKGAQLLEGKAPVKIRVRFIDEKDSAYEAVELGPVIQSKFAVSFIAPFPGSVKIKEVHLSADQNVTVTKVQWHRWSGTLSDSIE